MPSLPDILRGCKVFPCAPGTKDPATKNGWKDASADPAQIAEWERVNPEFNWAVACGSSGLFVFDIDPNGLDWWQRLLNERADIKEAVDKALQVQTPKGGLHVYFKGEGPSTASRIADGIDTRGGFMKDGQIVSGGYVILPGSRTVAGPGRVTGSYSVLRDGAINPLPNFLKAIIPERKKTDTFGLEKNPDHDQPRNISWAVDLLQGYVQSGRVSIEGKGGNNTAYQVAASILDKAISPAMCYELMAEHWNPHCAPPWDEWELETLIRNAASYGEDTEGGVKGFQSNADAFANFAGQEFEEPKDEKKRTRFQPMWLHEARKDVRPTKWLIPKLLPAEGTGILYGLSGSYKTFLALDWALCLAHGIPGQWEAPPVKHKVLYLAGESSYALRQERVDSWCEKQGLNPDDADFVFVQGVPAYNDKEGWTEIRDGLAAMKVNPEFIVIDTLTREMTGLDENSNNDAKLVLKHNEEMAQYYGCMVLAVGHTGKDQSKGLRGAQVFIDNSDAVLFMKKMASGVTLRPEKLKEVDCDGTKIFMEIKTVGSSIVLERSENIPDEDSGKAKGPRRDWASPEEIVKVLQTLQGETSTEMLVQAIVSGYGIDRHKVRRALNANDDLTFLRPSKDIWKIPDQKPEMEFDL